MIKNDKKLRIYTRTFMVILLLLLQIIAAAALIIGLVCYIPWTYYIFLAIGLVEIIYILWSDRDAYFKIFWIVLILVYPPVGSTLNLFVGAQRKRKKIQFNYEKNIREEGTGLCQDENILNEAEEVCPEIVALSRYTYDYGRFPLYRCEGAEYFPIGEDKWESMKAELEKAEKFIFIQYFILYPGIMLNELINILERKVSEGVEVRFMYDGFNTMANLPMNFPELLEKKGIKCHVYLPFNPSVSAVQNYRDHRKILVIDGKVAYTGGINIADEYINQKLRFGHWKDTAVLIRGKAVQSFTMMFLQMWNIVNPQEEDYSRYITQNTESASQGFVLPYGDSPYADYHFGKDIYLDLLYNAKKYVYIMTPYLIINDEMRRALITAAEKGIDVRIILPHIPDKGYALCIAKSHYKELMRVGIKIYEYTPGFIHAKEFIVDDKICTVGSVNLDYRSWYYHFECGNLFYGEDITAAVLADYNETMEKCEYIDEEVYKKISPLYKVAGAVLRLIAPLL